MDLLRDISPNQGRSWGKEGEGARV